MALEDFTTYSEVDPNNHISATAHHIDFQDYRNETAYLYRDKGAKFFGDFIHYIDVTRVAHDSTSGAFWLLANAVNGWNELKGAGEPFLIISFGGALTLPTVYMSEWDGTAWYATASHEVELGAKYFFRIVKKGTSLKCHVYPTATDREKGTNELEWSPLEITLSKDYNFRYIHVANTFNDGIAVNGDTDIDNLDLAIAPPEAPPTLAEILAGVPATIWAILALVIVVIVVAIYVTRKK